MRYLLLLAVAGFVAAQPVVFDGSGDIGETPKAGSIDGSFRVTGGGANVWGKADALFFAWKRIPGDVAITADVSFVGEGVNAHRKAMLLLRQDLTPGAVYADAALHGDGLTSLQFRESAGGETKEMRSAVTGPARMRIERRGNQIRMGAAKVGEEFTWTGPVTLPMNGPIYAGIGVSSHDAAVLETAVFSNLRIEQTPQYRSSITIYDLASRTTRTVYKADGVIEAPNWSRDGTFLLVNTGGKLYRLPVEAGKLAKLEEINLGEGGYRCNNDHDLSRDGKRLAFSASSPASR